MTIKYCWWLIFEILIVHKPFLGSCEVPHKSKYTDDRHVVNLNPSPPPEQMALKGIIVNRTGCASAEITITKVTFQKFSELYNFHLSYFLSLWLYNLSYRKKCRQNSTVN